MLRINNIGVTERAALVLRKQRDGFVPRDPGDVFALAYMSRFVNSDGTTVAGFVPGYGRHSVSPAGRGDMWLLAQPFGAPEFLFMPRFTWSADERYVIDVASEQYELLSIGPADTR
ncbi:hypothetical protein ABIB57_000663 [Devosia sp. UYZn731]|uniref:hypothetical protein n=1 Tax=Devosia sp. UYZn731 TaxID=3156345 RepID=UPI00339972BF